MRERTLREDSGGFRFRVRLGDYEVDIGGTRAEVVKTVEELPSLMINVKKAFESVKPKTVATLTVKTDTPKQAAEAQKYPKIVATENYDEAVLRVLETEWGKWRPRTLDELREALKANRLDCSGRKLSGVLTGLVKQGKIRRWSTDAGSVYILAQEERLNVGGT